MEGWARGQPEDGPRWALGLGVVLVVAGQYLTEGEPGVYD